MPHQRERIEATNRECDQAFHRRGAAWLRPVELSGTHQYARQMNNVKTAALLAFMGALFVSLGWWLGGQTWALFALGFAVLFNFGMYFYSDRLALAAARAKPATELELPNVYSIVNSLAQREQMPMPKIYLVESPNPNAFATGGARVTRRSRSPRGSSRSSTIANSRACSPTSWRM